MIKVLLIIHLIVTALMIVLILLQRSEGGGLGIGGGNGGLGGFAGPRATANALTRATMFLFSVFVGLSLILAILSGRAASTSGILNQLETKAATPIAAPVQDGAVNRDEPLKTQEKPAVPVAE